MKRSGRREPTQSKFQKKKRYVIYSIPFIHYRTLLCHSIPSLHNVRDYLSTKLTCSREIYRTVQLWITSFFFQPSHCKCNAILVSKKWQKPLDLSFHNIWNFREIPTMNFNAKRRFTPKETPGQKYVLMIVHFVL